MSCPNGEESDKDDDAKAKEPKAASSCYTINEIPYAADGEPFFL